MASPARQQYLDLKQKYADAILLYRLGDFYEMFDEDAKVASKLLGIQLTARSYPRGEGRVDMAGVPHHSVQGYIKRLIDAGHRVALCEQMSEPNADGKRTLVERDVIRVFTPATVVEDDMLEAGRNNYLAAICAVKPAGSPRETQQKARAYGLAYVDISTGEFQAADFWEEGAKSELEAELLRLAPAECLVEEWAIDVDLPDGTKPTSREADWRDVEQSASQLKRQLKVASLEGFGLVGRPGAVTASAAIVTYLTEANASALDLLEGLKTYSTDRFMVLDRYSRSSLELFPNQAGPRSQWTLLKVLDQTRTGMGSRRLRDMIGRPLLDIDEINRRLDAVECLAVAPTQMGTLGGLLAHIGDVERILNRVMQRKVNGQDLTRLQTSLEEAGELRATLESKFPALEWISSRIDPCTDVTAVIGNGIDPESGLSIRKGYSQELDGLRDGAASSRDAIARLEQAEAAATGIKSLKVCYNKVFGYYIEVSKASAHLVPDRYIRQQTLVNAERYFTPEIKEHETKILAGKDEVEALEKRLFEEILDKIHERRDRVLATASAVAELDAFRALAEVASTNNYVRPRLEIGGHLAIVDARHPVVEIARQDQPFVPNDCSFDGEQRIIVLTGPNMGGKSTMLRTVALIVLMAQIGSFVPADRATLGIVDRIFSRVGAQDDIAAGQSTFMTEMVETSNILRHATASSLLVLDEIGRGTSTYDGLAIARAVIEYIHSRIGARTLFATHYHELTALEQEMDQVRNYHTAVADDDGKITFLHKIVPGGADRSYGIHVARIAGLPHSVTVRAERILRQLEKSANGWGPDSGPQLALFSDPDLVPKSEAEAVAVKVLDQLLALDLSNTTPLEALENLHRFQEEGRSGT